MSGIFDEQTGQNCLMHSIKENIGKNHCKHIANNPIVIDILYRQFHIVELQEQEQCLSTLCHLICVEFLQNKIVFLSHLARLIF